MCVYIYVPRICVVCVYDELSESLKQTISQNIWPRIHLDFRKSKFPWIKYFEPREAMDACFTAPRQPRKFENVRLVSRRKKHFLFLYVASLTSSKKWWFRTHQLTRSSQTGVVTTLRCARAIWNLRQSIVRSWHVFTLHTHKHIWLGRFAFFVCSLPSRSRQLGFVKRSALKRFSLKSRKFWDEGSCEL